MNEVWKPVVGYEGKYEISNWGRVRGPGRDSSWGMRTKRPEYPMKLRYTNSNSRHEYLYVGLYKDRRLRFRRVHVLVAEAFIGLKPVGHQINHLDGCKTNNHVSNLEWVTPKENAQHAHQLGLYHPLRGESHPRHKLTSKQVKAIRRLLGPIRDSRSWGKRSQMSIAKRYGVSQTTIYRIYHRNHWNHL